MKSQTTARRRLDLTDGLAISIVEHHQRQIGDKTTARTAARIIQAFHAAGMSLLPTPVNSDPEAESLSRRAAGEPAANEATGAA